MSLKNLKLDNFTVFEKEELSFSEGINVFIGTNGTGKTHAMKVLYSACQSTRHDVSFSNKLVKVFKPDDMKISRLISRKRGVSNSKITVGTNKNSITAKFHTKTKKWDADIIGETKWEENSLDMISTYIPAKEILSNARNFEAAVSRNNIDFDDTFVDIISAAKIDITAGRDTRQRENYLKILQNITTGKVTISDDQFYLKPGTQAKIEFHLVAEGIRKLALLWQLIKNGTLEKGAILFWDEPEANINPIHMPILVEMLLELQRNGVQIFIATHDYILAKYFDVRMKEIDKIKFFSFYKDENNVKVESSRLFAELKHNDIMNAFESLLDEIYTKQVEV